MSTGRALRVRSTTPQTAMRAGGATCPQPPRPTLDALARDRSRCDRLKGPADTSDFAEPRGRASAWPRGGRGAGGRLEGRSGFLGNFAC